MRVERITTSSLLPNSRKSIGCMIITTISILMLYLPSLTASFLFNSRSSSSSSLSHIHNPRTFTSSILRSGDDSLTNGNEIYRCKKLFASSDSDSNNNKPYQVCILGGGFGGVNTALTLASLYSTTDIPSDRTRMLQITLIDPKERFVFLPLLYELCVGDASLDEVAPTYSSLLCTDNTPPTVSDLCTSSPNATTLLQWKQGIAIGVDVKKSCVFYNTTTAAAVGTIEKINYDALVICTGLDATPPNSIPGAQQLAQTFYTLDDCYALRKQLNNLLLSSTQQHVVIVGAGYSGVELSLNIMAFFKKSGKGDNVKVTLVQRGDKILPNASDFNRETAMKRIKESNIDVRIETSVVNVTQLSSADQASQERSCDICLSKKRSGGEEEIITITSNLLLWTAGANPPKKGILNSILPRDKTGRVLTKSTLQVAGFNNVFALGDCAKVVEVESGSSSSSSTSSYPATAQVAMQQAGIVAWNVYEVLHNDDDRRRASLLPFRYADLGEMMTLGTSDATISSLGGLFQTSGKGASALRRLVYAARMPTNRQRVTALIDSTSYMAANALLAKKQSTAST
jgi:NADH:ubiquinone reductase (non-electrogenic)